MIAFTFVLAGTLPLALNSHTPAIRLARVPIYGTIDTANWSPLIIAYARVLARALSLTLDSGVLAISKALVAVCFPIGATDRSILLGALA